MTTRIIRRTVTPVNGDALSLRDMVSPLMENAFISPEHWWADGTMATGSPAIDVSENNDAYTIKAALPGWKPENVDITFEGGTVTLKGEVHEGTGDVESNGGNKRWHRREIRRNSFARTVALPSEVEADKANAVFENGVLTLTLPKAEVVKPKQIKITAK